METHDLFIAYVTRCLTRASNFKAQTPLKHCYATQSIKLPSVEEAASWPTSIPILPSASWFIALRSPGSHQQSSASIDGCLIGSETKSPAQPRSYVTLQKAVSLPTSMAEARSF